jgi:hypothetical protein
LDLFGIVQGEPRFEILCKSSRRRGFSFPNLQETIPRSTSKIAKKPYLQTEALLPMLNVGETPFSFWKEAAPPLSLGSLQCWNSLSERLEQLITD